VVHAANQLPFLPTKSHCARQHAKVTYLDSSELLYILERTDQGRVRTVKGSLFKIGSSVMGAMSVYALVISLLWIFQTEVLFVSIFEGYTGQSLSDALAAGSKSAELWLITQRLIGVELLPLSLLMIFICQKSYRKGEKWSWYALLIAGTVTWGSLIGYKVVTGYFEATLSSLTFIVGLILFVIGITLPAKAILGDKSERLSEA